MMLCVVCYSRDVLVHSPATMVLLGLSLCHDHFGVGMRFILGRVNAAHTMTMTSFELFSILSDIDA